MLFAALILGTAADAGEISLLNEKVSYRGTLYPEVTESEMIPYRFPPRQLFPEAFKDRPAYPTKSGQSRTGTSIVVKTNSPTLTLRFKYEGATFATFTSYQDNVFNGFVRLTNPEGSSLTLKSTKPGESVEYRIVGPASYPTYTLIGIEIEDGFKLEAPSPLREKVYVALGDSISHGLRKDNTCQTWPWLVAESLKMELYNIAIGGSNANVDQVGPVTQLPRIDLMTMLWGYNDCINKGKSIEEYLKDMNDVLDEIRRHHPETKIFVLNLLQTTNHQSRKTELTIDDFRDAVRKLVASRVSASDENIYLIASETATNTEDDLNDVVHLSHGGSEKLATFVAAEVTKILSQ